MRFGITPLEADNLKNIFNEGEGFNSFTNFRYSDVILDVIEKGYQHCEITLDLFQVLPIGFDDNEKKKILNLRNQYDITFSAHFPIWSVELSSPNKFIREASIQSCIDSYNTIRFLESQIEVFVLHPTGGFTADFINFDIGPEYQKVILDLFTNYATQSVKKLIRETKIDRKKIAIENIQFPFDRTLDMINKLKTSFCLDTAHFLGGFSGEVDIVDTAKKYLDITSEIHLQDYSDNFSPPDHVALGRGRNFPVEFLKIINDYDFKGPVVFELGLEQAYESIQFIKANVPEIKVPNIRK
ncbi:MAG: TIM barrel protein [Candidatus Hermodarchaeota archaeon]